MNKLDKKIFWTLFFSIFAAVTGVGIVVPLLPVYAHDLGAGGLYIASIFGAFSLSRTIFMPYFGKNSDKKGRKPFIVTGLLAYAIISVAFILSDSVQTLIIIRFFQGIASAMIMPVTQAYIGDITPEGSEGFVMGLFNMSVFWSLSIGPLLGGVIHDRFSLDASFLCMGLLALVGFGLSLMLLPPTKSEEVLILKKEPTSWLVLLRNPNLAGLALFRLAYTACIGIIWGFLPVFADSEFSLSSSAIGLLVMLGVFISGLIHTPMGLLADRINRKLMIVIGGLVSGAGIFALQYAGGFWDLFLANTLFGLGGGIAMPALMALAVVKGNQTHSMGSVMGILTMAHSSGMLTGSILAGIAMDLLDLRHAFSLGSLVMVSGVGLFLLCCCRRKCDSTPL